MNAFQKFILTSAFFALIILGSEVRGQIVLEHTYNGYAYAVNLDVSGYKYYVLDTQNKTLKLYHNDHSLWKSVNLIVPNGYQLMSSVYNVSENLFSLDGKVGFSYSYYTSTPAYQAETRVMNEDGVIILTIPGATYAYAVKMEDEAKLLAFITNYTTNVTTTKVYDLPGDIVSDTPLIPDENMIPFPNPAMNSITIPYPQSEVSEGGKVFIFDASGQCLRTSEIDDTFDHLVIDANQFTKGTYFYKVINSVRELVSGKFIIR